MVPCTICNDAISFPDQSRVDVRHASDIEVSADKCGFCKIILVVLNEHNVERDQRLHITNDSDTSQTRATHGIKILVIKAGEVYLTNFDFVVRSLIGLDLKSLPEVLYSGRTHTGSFRAFEWAKAQIEACQTIHEPCKVELHPIPNQLIHLGQGDANDTEWLGADVKLYESGGEAEQYATLSHRWGIEQPLRLLKANLEEFKSRIPWSSLPRTFQQAIMVARKLHVPYLWIDSLCIIQDSTKDWRMQSIKMASIYERSFITIAASVAEDGEAGCFVSPPSFMVGYVTNAISKARPEEPRAILELVRSSNTSKIAFVRGDSVHPMPSLHLPLLTRGWAYQERLLSPRILHFAHDLIFECSCHIECYCKKQVGAASRTIRSHPPKLQHANALGKGLFKGAGGHIDSYTERWCAIIEEYSNLNLTFASDRLPAVAGLAKQMARYMPEARYMLGIWNEPQRLPVYLTWRRSRSSATAEVRKPRPGPSWTWVTMPGAVSFPRGSFYLPTLAPGFDGFPDLRPSVIRIDFEHEGDEDFMSIKGGSISLSGYIVEVHMQRLRTDQGSEIGVVPTTNPQKRLTSVRLDHEPGEIEIQSEWKSITPEWACELARSSPLDSSSTQAQTLVDDFDSEFRYLLQRGHLQSVSQLMKNVWAFCLGKWQTDGSSMDQFLVLEYVNESSNSFQRIGQGECSVKTSFFREDSKQQVVILE